MGKIYFSQKKKNNSFVYLIENKIKYPEVIHEKILKTIEAGLLPEFFPVKVLKSKDIKKAVLVCEVSGFINIDSYLRNVLSKDQFLSLVLQFISVINKCNDELLDANNIELRTECVFVDSSSKKIKCVYWPVVNNQTYIKAKDFFRNLPDKTNFASVEAKGFLNKYKLFFNDLKPFSIKNFEVLVLELLGKEIQTNDISPSSGLLNEDRTSSELVSNINDEAEISYTPTVASSSTKNIADLNNFETNSFRLSRKKSKENINIYAPVFKIGKSEDGNDYAISDNRAISRRHAEIHVRNNQYFIVDCNSTNGVKINGKKIKPSVEYKIKRGDKIHLANEEFLVE